MKDYNKLQYDFSNETDARVLTEDEIQDLIKEYYELNPVKGSLGQDYSEVKDDE